MDLIVRTPLSPYQRDIWIASSQFPELDQYTLFCYDRFTGSVDESLLKQALTGCAQRTDAFRLQVAEEDGLPYQWLSDEDDFPVECIDLTRAPEPAAAVDAWLQKAFRYTYPLTPGTPLLHLFVLRTSEAVYAYVRTHHMVCDAWGLQLFMSQVRAEYAQAMDANVAIPAAPSYLDVLRNDTYRESQRYQDDLAYFSETLAGIEPALFNRKMSVGSRTTARHHFTLERALLTRLREHGGTPFLFVTAAVSLYLAWVHQSDELVLGIPVFNREGPEARQAIGHFANTLPFHVSIDPGLTVDGFLGQLRAAVRRFLRHQRMPLGDAVRGHGQLFDTTISYLQWPAPTPVPGTSYETVAQTHAHDQDALAIWISEFDSHSDVRVDFEYACDVFDADFPIQSAARHIESILRSLALGGDAPIADLDPLSPTEHTDLISARNATHATFPDTSTLPEHFVRQVARTPDQIALVEPDGHTQTYAGLHAQASAVATSLHAAGVGPDDRVAVLVERGRYLIPAILGTQLAGAAYVPVDPTYPLERIRLLLEDCGAKAVLVGELAADLSGIFPPGGILSVADVVAKPPALAMPPLPAPDDLAYVIYTSGSTGRPKGVMVEHRSVVNRLWWMQRQYPICDQDVLLQKTPMSFDVSVWELFWWSFTGARLALLPPGAEKDPQQVLGVIKDTGVTVIHFVPSMLTPFLDLIENHAGARDSAASLRLVFCSGEALTPQQVSRFGRLFGDTVRLVNLYGPTEATVDVSAFDCPPRETLRVPIGKPIDNMQLYVLGRGLHPLPAGAPGELYIGGVGVARGYLNRPELTADRFIANPFIPGGRLYRSGDLARWLADGTVEYLGRADDQVKIRGNRVEPNEVRDHLVALPGMRDAAVVARTSEVRGTHLIGYYVANQEQDVTDLRSGLAATLPDYMIPSFFVRIDRIPLSANGKLDRKQLPSPQGPSTPVPPRTPTEVTLAAVWAEVLGVPSVGIHDDFHALGGDSILMLRLRAAAQRQGLGFELADLMRNPTVAGLAGRVAVPVLQQDLAPFELIADVDRARLARLEDAFPVSRLSLGLLFHTAQNPSSSIYHDVFLYRFTLTWDEAAFRRAVDTVVAQHPALRSSFDLVGGTEPLQQVHETVDSEPQVADLRNMPDTEAEAAIDRHVQLRRFHPYAVDHSPLYQFAAFVRGSGMDLVFSFHHAILDGWSVANLIVRLMDAYRGQTIPGGMPPLASHVREEQRALSSPTTTRYWADLLRDAAMTKLDGFGGHEPRGEKGIVAHRIDLPTDVLAKVKALTTERSISLKSVLIAAHCLTLHLFSRAETVVTGVVTHGRPELPGADRMVGLFLNTVPFRSETAGRTWADAAKDAFAQERDSYPHRRHPISAIQQAHGDVLHTAFNYVNLHALEQLSELRDFQVWEESNFSLFVNAIADPVGDGIYLRIDADGVTITRAQAELVGRSFVSILRRIVDTPDEAIDFAFLAPSPEPAKRSNPLVDVVTLFERQVQTRPDHRAMALDDRHWSYRELDCLSRSVATHLHAAGARRGDAIGVALNRSPDMLAAVWGILRAGLICVPLDVSYPEHRLSLIMQTAQPYRIIVHPEHAHVAPDGLAMPVEALLADIEPMSFPAPALDDLALLLFTSGSTGRPKGVELTHRMWANYTQWQLGVASGVPGMRTLQFAPLSFDMSFQEIFSTLCGGGELRLVSNEVRMDPSALLQLLQRHKVERALLPFVAVQRLAEASNTLNLRPDALRVLVSSGEQLRITDDIRQFCMAVPGLLLENQYGPTETHQVTSYSLTGDPACFPNLPPIGRPLDGVEIVILDATMRPVPDGVIGEIYLGGDCLARGYHRAPELTQERFLAHPWRTGTRLYRTGDLGRVLPDGNVAWLGRADTQVKVRGFRIEPAEVELAIMRQSERQPGLRAAAVVARTRSGGDAFLAAFLSGDPEGFDVEALKQDLRAELPDYMLPSYFAWVDAFALTPSGKRDDAALQTIPLNLEVASDYLAPRDHYEQTLAELLAELLNLPRVGTRDDFFALGGNSLTAMRFVLTIEKRYGVSIPITALIQSPTVEGLAERLRTKAAVLAFDPLVPIRSSGERPPLFLVHPLGGHVLCYLPLARCLPDEQPVYALQAAGTGQGSIPTTSIEEMAAAYLEAIRRVQPEGPYVLSGWSFGGFVAFEMARQLRASDPNAVKHLIVLDSITIRRDREVDVSDDALLLFFYWELVWFERSRGEVEPLPTGLTLEETLDHIAEQAIQAGVLPGGSSRATVQRLYALFRANWRALIEYRPEVAETDMVLLRADGPLPASLRPMHDAAGTLYGDPQNGWQHWTCGKLQVIDVPGDHLVLMKDPHVQPLAATIESLINPMAGLLGEPT